MHVVHCADLLADHCTGCADVSTGANEDNTELFWGLKESISPVAIDGSIYRIVPRKQSLLGLALQDAPNNSTAPVQ